MVVLGGGAVSYERGTPVSRGLSSSSLLLSRLEMSDPNVYEPVAKPASMHSYTTLRLLGALINDPVALIYDPVGTDLHQQVRALRRRRL